MNELPLGWVDAALDDIAIVNPGRIEGLVADTSVSFVPMPAVSDVDGEIVNPTVRPFAEVSKGYTQFQVGDVIFAKITPCMENGKIAVARSLENGVACGSTEFHVVRPLGQNSPDYIWRFLRQSSYRADAEAVMTGAVDFRWELTRDFRREVTRLHVWFGYQVLVKGAAFSFFVTAVWAELFLKRKLSFPVSRMWQ